ncbi:MAG TPA: serine hydrolase, partial [Verrucomicrobiae bacterium]
MKILSSRKPTLPIGLMLAAALCASPLCPGAVVWPEKDWQTATPESQGLSSAALGVAAGYAVKHGDGSGCVIRHGYLVREWGDPKKLADIKSATKGAVGTTLLGLALDDGLVQLDDPARMYDSKLGEEPADNVATGWLDEITVRHLATMTAGFNDERPPKLVRRPGQGGEYSNDTANMLAELLTLRFGQDLREVFRRRIADPIGLPANEWTWRENNFRPRTVRPSPSVGGDKEIKSREFASGITITHRALARLGYLYLREGEWNGRRILSRQFIRLATRPTELPSFVPYYAFYWGSNARGTYPEIPPDTYWALGLGDSFVLVCPSLEIVAVRLGVGSKASQLPGGDKPEAWGKRVAGFFKLVVAAVKDRDATEPKKPRAAAPYPSSRSVKEVRWAPKESIVRRARGSDNWPLTWAEDDALYTAYGDGRGFEPFAPEKLSLGIARIAGTPQDFVGENIRCATAEATGDGAAGKKASGLLMVDGVLYLWARNAGNSQLAWSTDHARTWTWADWKFTNSFGCPTFLNFGKDYAGARDAYVYVFSHDSNSAYLPADCFVLARVPKERIRDRAGYEFFQRLDAHAQPLWTRDMARSGAVFRHTGRCYRSSISYSAALKRYLWCQTLPGGDGRFAGGFGIFDASEPWGPWTTVFFTMDWDVAPGETQSFPTKWMSDDGRKLWLVFSGEDAFSVRQVEFVLAAEGAQTRSEPLRLLIETDAGGDPDDEQSL